MAASCSGPRTQVDFSSSRTARVSQRFLRHQIPPEGDAPRVPSGLPDGDLLFTALTSGSPPNNRDVMLLDRVSGRQKVLVTGGGQPEYVSPGYVVYALDALSAQSSSTSPGMTLWVSRSRSLTA
jgi:hypothetical protein